MKKGRLYNREEIETISKSAIGKSVNDILNEEGIKIKEKTNNKGEVGQLVEKYLFGIENNNASEPDFMPAGIELKVTAYKKIRKGMLSTKDRLVFNVIDYMTEYKNDFRHSHFWFKNNKIQLLWYLWEPNKDKKDYVITHEKMFELDKNEDLKQIEEDFNYIVQKIKEGKAHEISEADTMYLGACPKGDKKTNKRKQPFSEELAGQRAFCFKTSYMTELVRKYIGNYSDVEKVLNGTTNTFNEFVNNVINKYKGKTRKELMKEFEINSNAKNINSMLISRMFGVKGKLSDTDEFKKANIEPRTIRIEENGKIKESISFPYFKYTDIVKQTWEESDLKNELETTKYMFFVFKNENGEYVFKGIKLWNMPETDIETSVKNMWEKTQCTIKNGDIVREISSNGRRKTNFVGMKDNLVCHVRPHGGAAIDVCELPVKDKFTGKKEYTKHCFWVNSSYIRGIFEEFI